MALRLHPRHVGRAARCHRRVARGEPRPSTSSRSRTPPASRAESPSSTGCSCSRSSPARACSRGRSSSGPARPSLVARGKEVIVVGAGDAGQLVIREMLKSRPRSATRRSGSSTTTPRKKNHRIHGVRVLGTTAELPHILSDNRPDELLIAIPSASGEVRQKVVESARDARVPVKTLPGPLRADRRRLEPRRADPARAGRGHPRPRARRGRLRGGLGVHARRDGAHHRRRRLDRLRALPPGRTRGRGAADPRRPGRVAALRDRARARRRPRLPGERAGDRRHRQPREAAPGLRPLPAERRLPRGRVQARADDGGEPARVGAEQRARDEGRRRGRGRVRGARGSCSSRPTRR